MSVDIHVYKARARRNGHRIFKILHVLKIDSNCFLHVIQSKGQKVLIKLSDTYNVCCHGNSCAYGLHASLKTGYHISNAFVNTGCAYLGYLCSLCNCIHIKFKET